MLTHQVSPMSLLYTHFNTCKTRVVKLRTNRTSANDKVQPCNIPGKGAIMTDMAYRGFEQTRDICPNWVLSRPSARLLYGIYCEPLLFSVLVYGHLSGTAWTTYDVDGTRMMGGVQLPDGLEEGHAFETPIVMFITQDDRDIDVVSLRLASKAQRRQLKRYARGLFTRGTKLAENRDLVLVIAQYKFGVDSYGTMRLIDEVHTPCTARYWENDVLLYTDITIAYMSSSSVRVERKYFDKMYTTHTGCSSMKIDRDSNDEDETALLMQLMSHGHLGM